VPYCQIYTPTDCFFGDFAHWAFLCIQSYYIFKGYQGNQYKQAVSGDGDSLVIVPMDSNNTPLQVYDVDSMEFEIIDDSYLKRTDIEKASAYLGEGTSDVTTGSLLF